MQKIAKFEKVSLEQFTKAMKKITNDEAFINRIYEEIKLPKRATSGSAGYDFYAPYFIVIPKGTSYVIPTGIRCKMEDGWVLDLRPRSGHGFKHGIHLANTTGVIDSDYYYSDNEGHIMVKLVNDSALAPIVYELNKGDAFCQGLFLPYGITVDDEADGVRNGGFGSTGA